MNQGEIWLINLDPAIGAETNKTRPAVIVNTNALAKHPLKVIVPVADWSERFSEVPWMVKIAPDQKNGLIDQSAIDCFQDEISFRRQVCSKTRRSGCRYFRIN